eukprot:1555989-Alexandrium_andersonii.AAC.1
MGEGGPTQQRLVHARSQPPDGRGAVGDSPLWDDLERRFTTAPRRCAKAGSRTSRRPEWAGRNLHV